MADQRTLNGQIARDLAFEIFEMPGGPTDADALEDFIADFLDNYAKEATNAE